MNTKLATLVVFTLAVGLVGNAFAHKSQVIGDYDIEVGWAKEPPVAGKSNAIEITIAKASVADKKDSHDAHDHNESKKKTNEKKTETKTKSNSSDHEHKAKTADKKTTKTVKTSHAHKNGVKGLAKMLEVDVTLNNKKTTLTIKEDSKNPGTYTGKYTPEGEGHPTVHIYAKIKAKEIEGTFHPEKVEAQ